MARMGEELLHIEIWCKNFASVHSHNTKEVGRFKQRIFRETACETDVGWFHFRMKCDGRP